MRKLAIAFFLAILLVRPVSAQQDDMVAMDFINVDLAVVVKYISEISGKNFILDEKVQGNVTIVSPKKVTREEAYRIFESILEVYGFAALPSGNVTKIVPIAEARQRAGEVKIGEEISPEMRDKMITQIIPLKSISAEEVINIIRPLIAPTSYIAAYQPSNTVILVDLDANRNRIMKIIEQLDVGGGESFVRVHPLQYAAARDIAEKLNAIMTKAPAAKGAQPQAFQVIADERINALVIVGSDFYVDKALDLVDQLDVESPPGRQEINVVYLKNADAEELAKVINQIASDAKTAAGGKPPAQGTPIMGGKVQVNPDKATNSLLITAAPEDFATIERVIEKLDIRRRQVFVEALIFEIRTDDTSKFGVEWRTTSKFNQPGVQGIGGTNFGTINEVSANPFTAGQGLVLGVVDGVVSFGGKEYLNLGGLVQALRSEMGVNILSTPNLLTTDNMEAEIFVGENVPFVTSTAQTTGATPIQNIERKDVGIKLRIKPQVNEAEYVTLDIFQEISSISTTQLERAQDIITFKRSAQTTVVVKNNQNIIIGGLIREDQQEQVDKVPLLGDIPIAGWLFKSKRKANVKTNLMIFLTPHIISTSADLDEITNQKNSLMDEIKRKEGGAAEKGEKAGKDGEESRKETGGNPPVSAPTPAEAPHDAPGDMQSTGAGDAPAEVVLFEGSREPSRSGLKSYGNVAGRF